LNQIEEIAHTSSVESGVERWKGKEKGALFPFIIRRRRVFSISICSGEMGFSQDRKRKTASKA